MAVLVTGDAGPQRPQGHPPTFSWRAMPHAGQPKGARMKNRTPAQSAQLLLAAAFLVLASGCATEMKAPTAVAAAGVQEVNVTQAMLTAAGSQSQDWLHTNGDYPQLRYYLGSQINTGNVDKLRVKFVVQTEVVESMETAPI